MCQATWWVLGIYQWAEQTVEPMWSWHFVNQSCQIWFHYDQTLPSAPQPQSPTILHQSNHQPTSQTLCGMIFFKSMKQKIKWKIPATHRLTSLW
jgi:hypothetical protein